MVGRWIRLAVLPLSAWWMRVLAESCGAWPPSLLEARPEGLRRVGGGSCSGGAGRAPLGQMRLYPDS